MVRRRQDASLELSGYSRFQWPEYQMLLRHHVGSLAIRIAIERRSERKRVFSSSRILEAKVWCPPLGTGDAANTPGLWPAFWLNGVNGISGAPNSEGDVAEIDIMEAYSVDYTKYHTNWHVWNAGKQTSAGGSTINSKTDISQ
jgi:hypothetical protein